jgi:hypothetical protein
VELQKRYRIRRFEQAVSAAFRRRPRVSVRLVVKWSSKMARILHRYALAKATTLAPVFICCCIRRTAGAAFIARQREALLPMNDAAKALPLFS